ncbi:EAL domain-containing protein [Paucibacter sp. PLA-PC-4]|uniref:sensor domain-containing phosphodiesterase n=1 Tax=Paucibacter sp. PLA-PC-4 TaxID=2993655 RepID=UPI00224A6831|nr:EAL domain-containing protein [Paucibacter sp. PLA-PC-4]MCX2864597.1 EAL domain-containing protein [Paucibacter sp. PLA-PC-4]
MTALLATAVAELARDSSLGAHVAAKPSLERALHAIRTHLGMDVAFISEMVDGRRVFRHVDARPENDLVQVGNSDPAEESYCQRVIDGRLPELMTDACLNAEALSLPATRALPVGAHLSVPIRLGDGQVYGTFCCFSHAPDISLTARDLAMMRVFAEMVAEEIQEELSKRQAIQVLDQRIDTVLESGGLQMVYQPIFDVLTGRAIGFESLARFSSDPYRAPDVWFSEAAMVNRELELESIAIRIALGALAQLPAEVYIAVNASPEMIVKGDFADMLKGLPLNRIVVEVTEHQAVERYEDVSAVMRPLQAQGLRVAIDDAGAGYASFRHILNLHPHIVKLDISITRAIDTDHSRRALAAALRGFALETGCSIVAEGVETSSELDTLRGLGIGSAQGYHLGRPMPLHQAQALIH